jgi:hypothetical protein
MVRPASLAGGVELPDRTSRKIFVVAWVLALFASWDPAFAQRDVSPVLQIEPRVRDLDSGRDVLRGVGVRSIDGSGNNLDRSLHDRATGTDEANPREQLHEITGWIDASNVYGSDATRAAALHANDGTGRLLTGAGDLLPDSDGTLPNATGGSHQVMFLAGDLRANEQLGLTALHTPFMREHDRLADEIHARNPALDDDEISIACGEPGSRT